MIPRLLEASDNIVEAPTVETKANNIEAKNVEAKDNAEDSLSPVLLSLKPKHPNRL